MKIILFILSITFSFSSYACNDALSSLLYNSIKPEIENADLCADFDHIDKTASVKLKKFSYCLGPDTSEIKAQLSVKCKTSDSAFIKTSVKEDFDFSFLIDNQTCEVSDFDSSPKGDIGKLIAKNTNFQASAKKAIQEKINEICGAQ